MYILRHLLLMLGGVTLFLLGLKYMSENMENLAGQKMQKVIKTFTKNSLFSVFTGASATAVLQSSVATNVIVTSFTSSKILSLKSACAVIMGANIGTTITAQLVALSGSNSFDITAIGSLILFLGFIISFSKNIKLKLIGGVMAGFGMLFLGLDIISDSVEYFKIFQEFRNIFLVENKLLLFLNGIIITAIIQSSSAVTSVMIILAGFEILTFESSMFLILGSNVGSCFAVIISSLSKNEDGRRAGVFNLVFNLLGSLIFIIPLSLYSAEISRMFISFSKTPERAIANFHTIFNVIVTMLILPILTPLIKLISLIISDRPLKLQKTTQYV